jgi:hypothetical protein
LKSLADTDLGLIGTGLLQPPTTSFFDLKFLSIIRGLREAALFHEAYSHNKSASPIISDNEYFLMRAVWTLQGLLTPSSHAGLDSMISPIQDTCRLALLIFICTNKNLYPPSSALCRALASQLKNSFDIADIEILTFWPPAQDTLTWILCLGAYISKGREERRWFVSRLARIVRLREIYTWDGLRALLLKYFYLDSAY